MTDTLIVGGGTAGCVLAARLSEHPEHTVRLLEAGPMWFAPDEFPPALRDAAHLPIGADTAWLWRYPVILADDGVPVTRDIVRGRVIGGSGAINGSYFVRAVADDFAAWSGELGSETWSFDSVLPAYTRSERDVDFGDRPGHGSSGPVPVRRSADPAPLSERFATACVAAGFPEIPDLNSVLEPVAGVGPVPCNIEDGQRMSSASAYLLPALARPNLTVHGATSAARIRFRGTRAVGVDISHAGRIETLWADHVVLSAGAIESAALLLRSGVGDPEQLRALGIPVVRPAPVGSWFTDHPEIGLAYELGAPDTATVPLEYVLELDDIEIRPYTVAFTPGVRHLGVALMRPRSAGILQLRSADPAIPPVIEHRYLSTEHDRARLRDAVATASEVLRHMSARSRTDAMPRQPKAADAWLHANLATSQHLSGTCRMGAADDERAVVDELCRVHGLTGLSVVDLSVVPVPLSRGPQATTVMIAEHVAGHLAR
ncbi:putative dehydrogenase (TIGR03970 family) [Nocardia tenerifensis]|uniref:Putative dehydrogenase (TIGR03970 family) n=1 Tax=Nocardia tenerifensis TaxID=228006 RepID=A0A318KA50_9NOCA|nr:mycofactocin system GMC family oxidoreductase MftG [Nocardia tenerifensis]PXX68386.1 putative dehydrogenase (TIGR03970 family) [Nocardia tenerifensis]